MHIKRFDAIRKLFAAAAVCVHWFNPAVWLMYFVYSRDIELVCDEAAVNIMGEDSRAAYARALISAEESRGMLYSSFGKNSLEERIDAIMKRKKLTVCTVIAAVLITAGITAVFAASADNTAAENGEEIMYDEQGNAVPHNRPDYPVNERGETYGSALQVNYYSDWPDLVAAVGDSGISGYVRLSELVPESPSSPEEALRQQEERKKNGSARRVMTVYAGDGVTALDTLTAGGVTHTEESAAEVINVYELQDYAAVHMLQNMGFNTSVVLVCSPAKKNTVIRTEPEKYSVVPKGSEVIIYVSMGEESEHD